MKQKSDWKRITLLKKALLKSSNNERSYTSKSSATGRKDIRASLVQPSSVFRFDENQWCEPFRTPIVDVFRTDHRRGTI